MSIATLQATARSPLDFVACSRCRQPYLPTLPFFLTDCAHTLCQPCTGSAIQQEPAQQGSFASAQLDRLQCPACGHDGPLVRLDHAPALQHCFRPLQDLVGELGMAAEWQIGNLTDQLAYFRDKCAEQKKMLAKAATELKKMRELKSRVEQLARENDALQQKLAVAPLQQQLALPTRSLAHFASNDQNVPPQYIQLVQAATQSVRKRHRNSPDRSASPPALQPQGGYSKDRHTYRSYHVPRSPSVSSAPLAPARLSLTPAQQKQAAARQSAQSSRPAEAHAPQDPHSAEGRSSRAQEVRSAPSSKDRLARFAYNPSRASDRSAAATPSGTLHHNTSAEFGETHTYAGDRTATYQHDEMYATEGAPRSGPLDEAHLMPPPPVPTRRMAAPAASAFQPVGIPASFAPPCQAHYQHAPRFSAAGPTQVPMHGPGELARPSTSLGTATLPSRPQSAAQSNSHRQPFRPASAAARPFDSAQQPPTGYAAAASWGAR